LIAGMLVPSPDDRADQEERDHGERSGS
jgi:hypothetical protein